MCLLSSQLQYNILLLSIIIREWRGRTRFLGKSRTISIIINLRIKNLSQLKERIAQFHNCWVRLHSGSVRSVDKEYIADDDKLACIAHRTIY